MFEEFVEYTTGRTHDTYVLSQNDNCTRNAQLGDRVVWHRYHVLRYPAQCFVGLTLAKRTRAFALNNIWL